MGTLQHQVLFSSNVFSVSQIEKKTSDNLVGSRKRKARKHNITRLEPGSNKKGMMKEYYNCYDDETFLLNVIVVLISFLFF